VPPALVIPNKGSSGRNDGHHHANGVYQHTNVPVTGRESRLGPSSRAGVAGRWRCGAVPSRRVVPGHPRRVGPQEACQLVDVATVEEMLKLADASDKLEPISP
jgi:hypothetical protein